MTHARLATATSGISPSVLAAAWMDWAVHLATSPGKPLQMMQQAFQNAQALAAASLGATPPDAGVGHAPSIAACLRAPGHALVTIADMGAVAVMLASDGASRISGDITFVDGGLHVRA